MTRRIGMERQVPVSPNGYREDAPNLPAYDDGKGNWWVWCEDCQQWQSHGAAEGHRVAHCSNLNSRYRRTGYNLIYAGEWTPVIRKQHKAARHNPKRRP